MRLSNPHARQSGFSMIEMLVGIVMALLTTYAIMTSYKAYEGQKRTTASNSDALMSSQFMITQLEHEIMLGGYGFQTGRGAIGCDFSALWTPVAPAAPATGIFPVLPSLTTLQTGLGVKRLVPVLIVDGGGTAPDAIRVMYGSSSMPLPISGATSGTDGFAPTNNTLGFNVSDMVVLGKSPDALSDTTCQVGQVTDVAVNSKISLTAGAGTCLPSATCSTGSTFNSASVLGGSTNIYNVGTLSINSYFVGTNGNLIQNAATLGAVYNTQANGTLTRVTTAPAISTAAGTALMNNLGTDVVNLQAQYGLDTKVDTNNIVDSWVDPTGTFAASAMTAVQARQIRAIRFAMVVRSALPENKKDSNGDCMATPTTTQANSSFSFKWPDNTPATIDLSQGSTATTWRCYRYQVFTDVVPLRNAIWSAASYESNN